MSVLDFIFVANPLPAIRGESVILERDGDHAAVEIDFDDSEDDTDHRPVAALFTIGTEGPDVEDVDEEEPVVAAFDRAAILARIAELERELQELRALVTRP